MALASTPFDSSPGIHIHFGLNILNGNGLTFFSRRGKKRLGLGSNLIGLEIDRPIIHVQKWRLMLTMLSLIHLENSHATDKFTQNFHISLTGIWESTRLDLPQHKTTYIGCKNLWIIRIERLFLQKMIASAKSF